MTRGIGRTRVDAWSSTHQVCAWLLLFALANATEPLGEYEDLTSEEGLRPNPGTPKVHLQRSMDALSEDLEVGTTRTQKTWGSRSKGWKKYWKATTPGAKTCPGHCKNDCDIPKNMLDSKCGVTKSQLRSIKRNIEYTGNATFPMWTIWKNYRRTKTYPFYKWTDGRGDWKIGNVSCPCDHVNGRPMNREQAGARIMGQIAAMDVPRHIGAWGKWGRMATRMVFMKYTYSTQLMLRCWTKHCTHGKGAGTLKRRRRRGSMGELDLNDPMMLHMDVDIQDVAAAASRSSLSTAWGGGVSC